MDAILLAAGLGTRLRPHTLTTPKPLLPVQGRPILDWILGALPREVERVLVVVNYLAEQVEAYLQDQRHFAHWRAVRQEQPRGTGDAFRSCTPYLEADRVLVLNGDDLIGAADLSALVHHPAGLLVRPVENPRQYGVVFTRTDSSLVDRLVEKPDLDGPALANVGAYLFPRDVLDYELKPSPRGEYEITDYVTALAGRQPVHAVPCRFWYPIGTVDAWRGAEALDLSAVMRRT
jgi:bifunctional UDP-N-acetylglucosamine pyrophosphorylase/glucosamine-1-phosphate N-acetyltransferase